MKLFLSGLVVLVMLLAGCAESRITDVSGQPEFEGEITARWVGEPARVLVRLDPGFAVDSVLVSYAGARIRVLNGDGRMVEGGGSDLVVGSRVRVWTDGVEFRSDPIQVHARHIEIGH